MHSCYCNAYSTGPLQSLFIGILLLFTFAACQPGCATQTAYNSHSEDYPYNITAVVNGTFSLIFLHRAAVQGLLPEGYSFLDNSDAPARQEVQPMLIRSVYVHDIRSPDDMWRNDYMVNSHVAPLPRKLTLGFSDALIIR